MSAGHLAQLRVRRPVDPLDEDVDDPAAGESDCEGRLVAHAVPLQHRLARREDLLAELVDRALDAAARHTADRLARPGPTSITAPGGRGADSNVATTVPTATDSPASHHVINRSSTSRIGDHLQKVREAGQAVPRDEVVDMRQDGDDPGLHRQIPGLAAMRIEPDHPVRQAGQTLQLRAEQRGVPALPPVTAHHHDGTPRHPALAPAVQEHLQHLTEPGTTRPVRYDVARRRSANSGSR